MPRNLVLFDLEWNIGYQPYTFNYHGVQQTFRGEIVEIGAVKIDEDANVLDTFSIHLRPRIFRKLQHHIAKVTGLTQADLDKGEPIVQGLRRFMQWCGPDAEFAEWGMDDVPVLKQNLFLCNLDESRPTVWYDLQQLFLREYPRKEGEGMKLENVVTRMGIPLERPFHDALSDTLYTADLCRMLDLRAGLAAYPSEEDTLRQSLCPTPGDYRDFRVFQGYLDQSMWKLDPVIGRDAEIRNVIRILSRKTKNNPVLVGEPGVGKTAVAEGLALRIAAGEPMSCAPRAPFSPAGHAIELRINAEDPAHGFRPCPGTVTRFEPPAGPGVRVETYLRPGAKISPHYDSLVAKVIVHGQDREEAVARARRALDEFVIEGIATTIPFHQRVLQNEVFLAGEATTDFIETQMGDVL